MTTTFRRALGCALLTAAFSAQAAFAQTQNAYGQDIVPVYEGWERNPDGSFNMVFGYMNRNYVEQMDIPVGADNFFTPGAADQGQPTHFYRRRQQFIFKIRVPKDWGQKDLVWTLKSRGQTEKAFGTLLPVWEIGNLVYQENRGGPGTMSWPEEPDEAPSIEMVGSSQLTVNLPETLTLTVDVSDDGHPLPRVRRANTANVVRDSDGAVVSRSGGASETIAPPPENPVTQAVVKLDPGVRLGVTWILYRGPAQVTFEPQRVPIVNAPPPGVAPKVERLQGKATTKVTFTEPGEYVLRAYGDDGILATPIDVKVNVRGAK